MKTFFFFPNVISYEYIPQIEAAENELSSFIKQSGESKEEDDAKQKNDQTEALNEQSKEQSLN